MTEKRIPIVDIEPSDLYGVNNKRIERICNSFPKLKIIARGSELVVLGSSKEIEIFEERLNNIIKAIKSSGNLDNSSIDSLVKGEKRAIEEITENDIILYGVDGKIVKAKTKNQKLLLKSYAGNDLIFALGPAGTGKTYTAIALAVRALKNKEVRRLILTRPAVEAGERLGFLPGDLKEKLDPYLQPLYDALRDMIPAKKLEALMEEGIIQIAPLAYMRGRTLENSFVILDEAQNTTFGQLKMFLTRMGHYSKFVVTGDMTQIDLPKKSDSGLHKGVEILGKIRGIKIIHFGKEDIVRHPLVTKIVNAFEKSED